MKQIFITNIGLVNFVKSRRSKHVTISIRPDDNVRVSLPFYSSYKYAEYVLLEKQNWVRSKLQKVQLTEEKKTTFTFDSKFRTKNHHIDIVRWSKEKLKYVIRAEITTIQIPNNLDVLDKQAQQFITEAITETYRVEAKMDLPLRVKKLAAENGISINNVFIKNMKSQWGSCSKRKNINLNLHLMRLPDELIDYVIMHELTHINEMNHSKKFWHLLERRFPNSKYFDKKIKEYSINYW